MVFDSELQQQRTLPAADMGDVYDMAEMSNGDVVMAAKNGLFHSSNGKWQIQLVYQMVMIVGSTILYLLFIRTHFKLIL